MSSEFKYASYDPENVCKIGDKSHLYIIGSDKKTSLAENF